ncbi:MAG: diphosphate--fructose-6-phosphate 1-phosphotransferase [Muribaculaceae bacterium]|nr:diphosphate--fructose-6-phosphate 1-phosphotransferase [Muribaculaceae bacterium]
MANKSVLQQLRADYQPKLPEVLRGPVRAVMGTPTESVADQDDIKRIFPCTYGQPQITFEKTDAPAAPSPVTNVGVILSGGQAPGGHNVISGLFDGLKAMNPANKLYGFLMGPDGLVNHEYKELTADIIDEYRNTGGFDIIGSGRTKLDKVEQFEKGRIILEQLNISALVIIGGDDSNTNAAILAEYYKANNVPVQVIGCPKTIDGDLKNEFIETSFGFDTATKVYAEVIGNIERDCNSAKKYWHFIKLMGRSASHITLECGLQTQPNVCIISEEVEAKNMTLNDLVNDIAQVVADRAARGMNYGTVLVPEGLIEFIPAFRKLINEMNLMLANHTTFGQLYADERREYVISHLSNDSALVFMRLPLSVSRQLTLDRDSHGNVQLSLVETEKMLAEMVRKRLIEMKMDGKYNGKFAAQTHFFGYEGRCAAPSNFDADYCYALGYNAAHLVGCGATGYMSSVRGLTKPSTEWVAGGFPITMMMNMEVRNAEKKPVIKKALVDLEARPFKAFAAMRDKWAHDTCYIYPGPIQYFGPAEVCDQPPRTLYYEQTQE